MKVTPEQFNKAFAEFQQFGPRRRIPIEERWREVLLGIDPMEFAGLLSQCKDIEAFALTLAEQVRDKKLADVSARTQLAEKYPFLTQGHLDHTWSQAMYFSFK